ncbi:MAG TPA: hypothetical protein VJ506_04145 [Candidatus Limnocylindrales bacterium]|nr:hypothetical protein [Candidatus Limnocylindrales bacterium]
MSTLGEWRAAPPGMPAVGLDPPVVAESGDPFAVLRVVDLVARIPRGQPVAVRSIVDHLNAEHLDWLFDERVVVDALVQLQVNWMADYRNTSGIVIDEAGGRATVKIEDSTRVDPWIVRQAERLAASCREVLRDFSLRDRPGGE